MKILWWYVCYSHTYNIGKSQKKVFGFCNFISTNAFFNVVKCHF